MQDTTQQPLQKSVLDAIRDGQWDYEPEELSSGHYRSTGAMPGSSEKLAVLAERAELGLPLWHDGDRLHYEDAIEA